MCILSPRPGNAALKKQADEAGGKLQLQEKTRGEEKKLLPPGKLVAEAGKVVTREKGGSQEEKEDKEKKESRGEEEQYENRKEGTREDCQSKGVAEEKSEVKAEKEKDPTISKANVNERVEGKEVVEGEKEERVTGAAGEVLPVGVVDVDAYCDNREPHVSKACIQSCILKNLVLKCINVFSCVLSMPAPFIFTCGNWRQATLSRKISLKGESVKVSYRSSQWAAFTFFLRNYPFDTIF